MNLSRWLTQRKPDWEKLEELLNTINAYGIKGLSNHQILTLGSLYRSVSSDLSRARANNVGEQIIDYLNSLTSRTHNYVYSIPPKKLIDVWNFIAYEFPRSFRACFPQFLLAFSVFWIGALLAMITVHNDPLNTSRLFMDEMTIQRLQQGQIWTESVDVSPITSSLIMTHNINIALSAVAYGIMFGVGTLYILFYNGFHIGGTVQVVIENGLGFKILTFIASHGVIELTTIYIAGAAGLLIGWSLVNPGEHRRWDAVKLKINQISKLALGCGFLLIIAGTFEGLISPNENIPPGIKFTIAILSGICLILYFALAGRDKVNKNKEAK